MRKQICTRCKEFFDRTGKFEKVCDNCNKNNIKRRERLKNE